MSEPVQKTKLQIEEEALRDVLTKQGVYAHKRTAADMEGVFMRLLPSIPATMQRWDEKKPVIIIVAVDKDSGHGTLFHEDNSVKGSTDPVLFEMQDYAEMVRREDPEGIPMPPASMVMGFLGECLRGITSGSKTAPVSLAKLMRFLFEGQTRVYMQVGLDKDFTVTVEGYYTDA